MGACFDVQTISPGAKSVLVAMADNAWEDGSHVFPSRGLLKHKTNMSLSSVDRGIVELLKVELIFKDGVTDRGVNVYSIDLRWVRRLSRRFGVCEVCASTDDITKDHWIPRSKGGTSDRWNAVRLCEKCNKDKGDTLPEVWLKDKPKILAKITKRLVSQGLQIDEGGRQTEVLGRQIDNQTLSKPLEEKNSNDAGEIPLRNMDMADGIDPSQEPEYIDDVEGVPEEWLIEWFRFLEGWKYCFPDKAQPRKSNTGMKKKFKTRFKNEGFRKDWGLALIRTKTLAWAKNEGWFKAEWFVKNDDNYLKLLDGTFDFKVSNKAAQEQKETRQRQTVADHGGDREAYRKANQGGSK